ncbi:MAG: iron ABC transporter permease [Marinilabiliales bacterium]|nr:MAG: iron ABC transporter permease [Marinilabiliales bacterium]
MKEHRDTINSKYRLTLRKKSIFMILVFVLLLVFMLMGLCLGAFRTGLSETLMALFQKGESNFIHIVWNIRMPRVLSAVIAGSALSVSGAAMQGILKNPLASPVTLGISHAAAFGAAFAIIILGAGSSFAGSENFFNAPYIVNSSAFVWSLISTAFILLLSRLKGSTPEIIILSGVVASSLFVAGTSALQYMADDIQLSSIVFWMFGDLGKASWNDFYILSIVTVLALSYFIFNRWNYNAMNAGDEVAKSMGVKVERLRIVSMLVASLVTAMVVSFYGIIGFVGLVVPHITRRIIGSDDRFLIPASALAGGVFLLVSDIAARTILSPVIIPVGILTSFIGAPLFIYLLIKGIGRGQWQ